MYKFRIIVILLFLTTLLISCHQRNSKNSKKRPNILLFLIDDYGYGDISFEGNNQIKTPNIDRIAKEGARFTRFYQSSGACAPTRASLLTGRYYLETGVWGVHYGRDFLKRDETTIADVLKDAGYKTGAFGKWHSGKTWSYFSWNRGFDVGVHPVLYRYFDTRVLFNNKLVNVDGPITDVVGDQVVKFIKDNQDNNFFCYVPFQSIHEPFNCPADVFQKYKNQGYSDHVARLYGMIEVMDDNIGKILNTVDDLGLKENTVIMFLSDDGPSPGVDLTYANRRMNDEEKEERRSAWPIKLRGGKGSIWEGGSTTPFYIQWKDRIIAGKDYDHLSGVIDLFPTILDICDVELPEDNLPLAGKSFWPVLKGKEIPEWNDRMYFDNSNFYRVPREKINMERPEVYRISVHHKNYKLVRTDRSVYGSDQVRFHLFDLASDPKETNNIYDQRPEIAGKLSSEIDQWYEQILNTGRAFGQAVFEVGNWEERATPINFDAVLAMKGSVKRSERSEFVFDNWVKPGSAMTFEIDVVEPGTYQVELLYNCDPSDFGSVFNVYTENDTAEVKIDHQSNSISGPLKLPAGRQLLTLELKKLGGGKEAAGGMRTLLVHRIPGPEDSAVLQNLGFTLESENISKKYFRQNDVAGFRTRGSRQDELTEISQGNSIRIIPFADNTDQIETIEIFDDFQLLATSNNDPWTFSIDQMSKGKHTLNVEFTSKNGVKNSVRAYLHIK